jgi:hypothetical protein
LKFKDIPIDDKVSKAIITDLIFARGKISRGMSPRMYRIPATDFNAAVSKTVQQIGKCRPFRPTLLGLPVDMTARFCPEIVVVADDDTNLARSAIREDSVE